MFNDTNHEDFVMLDDKNYNFIYFLNKKNVKESNKLLFKQTNIRKKWNCIASSVLIKLVLIKLVLENSLCYKKLNFLNLFFYKLILHRNLPAVFANNSIKMLDEDFYSNYTKYNFTLNVISNINFYTNLFKYYPVFNQVVDLVSFDKNRIYDLLPITKEIIELQPDKAKKIFFKKKKTKLFTYLNEMTNSLVYRDDFDDIEFTNQSLVKKHAYVSRMFVMLHYSGKFQKVAIYADSLFSNKPQLFWKKRTNSSYKVFFYLSAQTVKRGHFNFISILNEGVKYNFYFNTYNPNFTCSNQYYNINLSKADRNDVFSNMFLYNVIKLCSKKSVLNFSYKYNHLNQELDFKDYPFEKNTSPLKDDILLKYKNKNTFNNFFPLYCLSYYKFKKMILFSKQQQSPSYSSYYVFYLLNFLESLCKSKIWLKINTKKQISDKVYETFVFLFNKNRSDQINIGKYFFLIEFYEVIYLSFINRDINFFAMWFKKIMEKIHLKKHKKMIKVVHNTIKNNEFFLELSNLRGFSMDIRGKLGTAGNSKKKHYAFTIGSIAPTTKSHGLNLCQTTVRTSTGVLGVTILMSY